MMERQNDHSKKTPEQVAAQIQRIGNRLYDRVVKNEGAIEAIGNRQGVNGYSNDLVAWKNEDDTHVVEHKKGVREFGPDPQFMTAEYFDPNLTGISDNPVILSRRVKDSRHATDIEVHSNGEANVIDRDGAHSPEEIELTSGQTVTAAAAILSGLRNELAHREIEIKTDSSQKYPY